MKMKQSSWNFALLTLARLWKTKNKSLLKINSTPQLFLVFSLVSSHSQNPDYDVSWGSFNVERFLQNFYRKISITQLVYSRLCS